MDARGQSELRALEERGIIAVPYRAGRTMAMGARGLVASSHCLATQAGLDMLRSGGRAMDAAVAAAAMLAVVEPMMTGPGGDAFFLVYEPRTRRVFGLNGSGRAPRNLPRDHFGYGGNRAVDPDSWEAVTVPGAVDAWFEGLERFGSKTMAEVLAPAIRYAEEGFPITETVHRVWSLFERSLLKDPFARRIYLDRDRAPQAAGLFRNPALARSLGLIAEGGREAFYCGPIAREIVRHATASGGFLTLEDFAEHRSTWVEPIRTTYGGYELLQIPPNGQGIGVLLMLNILEGFDLGSMRRNGPEYLHLLIEAKKIAYADLQRHVADPDFASIPVGRMLSKAYAAERRALIDPSRVSAAEPPDLFGRGDTVYLTAIDSSGEAVSFINSIYDPFGAKIVGGETGILLHNRGAGFTLKPGHPNEYAPGKRPYHTIIPGMVLKDGGLYLSYGLMGGAMQPQGHVQFLLNHLVFGLTIQEAIDAPRFRHEAGLDVRLEHGIPRRTMEALEKMGHRVVPSNGLFFGGAQAILVHPATGMYLGGSDPRKDGIALGY